MVGCLRLVVLHYGYLDLTCVGFLFSVSWLYGCLTLRVWWVVCFGVVLLLCVFFCLVLVFA